MERRRISADPDNPQNKLPRVHGKKIDPYQLAVSMFDPASQICGKTKVERPDDFLFKRICKDCRLGDFIGVGAIVLDDKHEGLHAAANKVIPKMLGASIHSRGTVVESDRRLAARCSGIVCIPDIYDAFDMFQEVEYAADNDKL
ncbi:hypothetical protein JCM10295v2_005766 [Rhodotorula toruloides]